MSGENTIKLQTDNPNVLKAPGGSVWPYVLSIPSGTEASFEFETNSVTEPTQVRLFACKSSLANADCRDETSEALVTFTVLPPDARPPDSGNRSPYNVAPIPISLAPSIKVALGGVVDLDVTTHLLIKVGSSNVPITESTPASDTPSTTTGTDTSTGGTGDTTTNSGNVYEIDTDNRALLVSPNKGGTWPVSMTFNGGFNSLLRVKTRSPQKVGATGPVFVKIFARKPGASKTAIATIQVQ